MIQTLVLSKKFYESINKKAQLEIIDKHGYKSADDFINAIISNLNTNYSMFNIGSFRFFTEEENKDFSMYGAFVDNFKNDDFDRVLLCFTPIDSKLGNTIISQELMPLVNKELKSDIRFFLNKKIKKILLFLIMPEILLLLNRNKLKLLLNCFHLSEVVYF